MRQFDVAYSDPLPLTLLLRQLGQDLLSPPNVKGWPGGEAWINSTTLLARKQFLERLFRVDESRMQAAMTEGAPKGVGNAGEVRARATRAALDIRFSSSDWLRQFEARDTPSGMQRVLLALSPASEAPQGQGMDLIRQIVADPAYQLK